MIVNNSLKDKYQLVLKTALDGFCIIDIKGNFVEVNEAYCKLMGYSEKELLEMNLSNVEALEKKSDILDRIRKIIQKKQDEFETKHKRADGSLVDIFVTVKYINHENDFFAVFFKDITERNKIREKLNRNMTLLEKGEELSSLGYFERYWQTGEGYWSEGFLRLLGAEDEEIKCSHDEFKKFIHTDDRELFSRAMEKSIVKKEQLNIEFRLIKKTGEQIFLKGTAVHRYNKNDKPEETIGVFQDITNVKKIENDLNNKIKELRTFNTLTVGRELKMLELKKEIEKLKKEKTDSN